MTAVADRSDDRYRIATWLSARIAAIVGIDAESIDPRAPLAEYGLGSVDAVSLSGELEERLGLALSPTLVFDFPTIDQLADHLSAAVGGAVP